MELPIVYMFPTLHRLLNDCNSPTIDTTHVTTSQQSYLTALPTEQTVSHYEVVLSCWETSEHWQRQLTLVYEGTDGTLQHLPDSENRSAEACERKEMARRHKRHGFWNGRQGFVTKTQLTELVSTMWNVTATCWDKRTDVTTIKTSRNN
jgi:hypothetical protein